MNKTFFECVKRPLGYYSGNVSCPSTDYFVDSINRARYWHDVLFYIWRGNENLGSQFAHYASSQYSRSIFTFIEVCICIQRSISSALY